MGKLNQAMEAIKAGRRLRTLECYRYNYSAASLRSSEVITEEKALIIFLLLLAAARIAQGLPLELN